LIHEFRLSSRGSGGVFCDENGAFVGAVPLLVRTRRDGKDEWRPRDCDELSKEMSAQFGLPVDLSSKRGGLDVIARALSEGDLVRAQVATLLLGIPDPPSLSKGAPSRQEVIRLASDLHRSRLLKADWDPDQHPRWPAGAPDAQGGQFAPKDEPAAGPSAGEAAHGPQSSADASGAGRSADRQVHDPRAPANNPSAPQGGEGGEGDNRDGSNANDLGIYASYGRHIGGARLASASIAIDGLGIATADPADWANITRLANGALKLGSGAIITAAMLLAASDDYRERAALNAAISKFEFDPTSAADVLAVRAYVWSNSFAPWNYFEVPVSGPQLESVSQSIMAVELARPGTLYLALQGDAPSGKLIDAAVEDGLQGGVISESGRVRPTCRLRSRPQFQPRAPQLSSRPTTKSRPTISFPQMCGKKSCLLQCLQVRRGGGRIRRRISSPCRPMRRPRRAWLQSKVLFCPFTTQVIRTTT
jgi:hypothetical protein